MTDTQPHSIHALQLGPMENFVYLIEDRATRTAAVVDPAWDIPAIIERTERAGARVTDVLLTHSHHDHVNGLEELLAKYDANIHLLKPEAEFWGRELPRAQLHHGGDRIALGKTELAALHTPGHTPGSTCYRVGNDLISGDTLFVYGCGRCDLPGGDPERMFDTLKRLQDELPRSTVIHPGHNYGQEPTSTLKDQIEGNPFMQFDNREEFVQYRQHGHNRSKPYGPAPR